MRRPLGVYVHWPYCARICPYCDFNVVRSRGRSAQEAALAQAIVADLRGYAERCGPRELVSIFFGGGTPSLMSPEAVAAIIQAARTLWPLASDVEVTLEANPTDAARLGDFQKAGVSRLSLGVQALDDATLRFLGRDHSSAQAREAVERALSLFSTVSLDLIYAVPGQGAADWKSTLEAAVALGAGHLSPYQLTIEAGTAFDRARRRGLLVPLADDVSADLYELTQTLLGEHGFDAYEVSNHARSAADRSRHNLVYWRGEDYVGVGPGAHGRLSLDGVRYATVADRGIGPYIARVEAKGCGATFEALAPRDRALERLLMGLRTVEGVATAELSPLEVTEPRLAKLAGFAQVRGDRLYVTDRGRPVLDRVISELAG